MSPKVTTQRALPELDAEVVALQHPQYGSAELESLSTLAGHLRRLAQDGEATQVVLDVSAVRYAGAAWLGVIAEFVHLCRKAGRRVLLSGDETGLLAWAKFDQAAPIYRTVTAALRNCQSGRAWPSRFALPLPLLNPNRTDRFAFRAD
jgi:hypothetical protein